VNQVNNVNGVQFIHYHARFSSREGRGATTLRGLGTIGDHGAGVPEWTPEGVYDFCRSRSRTRSRIFEWKPDPEQEWEFQFFQESDNWFY